MKHFFLPAGAMLVAALGIFPLPSAAEESESVAALETPQTPVTLAAADVFASPVDSDSLALYRGGAQTHNDMVLDGITADNVARNVATGDNAIASGSFANMSGLPIVIQNSGANVLIQNAVILNLQMN